MGPPGDAGGHHDHRRDDAARVEADTARSDGVLPVVRRHAGEAPVVNTRVIHQPAGAPGEHGQGADRGEPVDLFMPCLVRHRGGPELESITLGHPLLDDYLAFVAGSDQHVAGRGLRSQDLLRGGRQASGRGDAG